VTPRITLLAIGLGSVALGAAGAQAPAASPAPRAAAKPSPPPPPVFEGLVTGPDEKPIAQATVVVSATTGMLHEPPLVARTGEDGRFRIPVKRRAPHALRVEAAGLAAQRIDKAMPGTPVRVRLARGGTIEGVVRDAATREPVTGARVEAREDGMYGPPPWDPGIGVVGARTDARGAFKLEGLARGRHTVTASSRGAGRASQSGVGAGQRVELLLVAGPSIGGRALAPDGKPAAGAAVRAEPEVGFGVSRLAAADADGRFEISGLVPGTYRLIAHHPDWAVGVAGGLHLERADLDAEVVLAPPVRVTGRLVDPDQRPRRGTVALQDLDGVAAPRSLALLIRADAGDDGRFALERVPPGSHSLAVTASGVAPRRIAADVGGRGDVVDLGDVVLEPGPQIRGRVRDATGAPVADAAVRTIWDGSPAAGVHTLEGRTEADGAFALGGATAARYQLHVQAPGFAAWQQPVDAPSEGIQVVLEAAGSIAGLVVDEGGRPVDAFEVAALPSGGREAQARQGRRMRPVTSEDGRFVMDDLTGGVYAIQVVARDLGRAVVSGVKVMPGGVTDLGRIRLAAGGVIRGTVVDAASAPIAGATVEARGTDRPMGMIDILQNVSTDAAGAFQLRGLPAGRAIVIARHPEFAPGQSPPVDVEAGRAAEATVVMGRGGRIEGVVRSKGGPPPGVWISAHPSTAVGSFGGPPASATPEPDGSFVLDRVPAGRVGVSLATRGAGRIGTGMFKEVQVREGETTRVDFVWREILVSGKVTRGGVPLPNVRLSAHAPMSGVSFGPMSGGVPAPAQGPQRMTAVTREDGSYEMIVGETGRVGFSAQSLSGGKTYAARTVEIADVEAQTVDLDYPAGGLSGTVVDAETDAPVANASVSASRDRRGGPPSGGHARTTADGRFSIDVEPGDISVRAMAEGYAPETVTVTVGEAASSEVRVALSRGARIRGRILDHRGRPAPGVWVTAREEVEAGLATSAVSSVDGGFEFSAVRPGAYTLAGGSPLSGFGVATGVAAGSDDARLRLRLGGKLRVVARGPDDAPIERAFVSLRSVDGIRFTFAGASGRTAADGTAEIDVPAGLVEVEVRAEAGTASGRATVAPGGAAVVEVKLAAKAPPPAP
jgi:protocatechuate 3,4-dioxygenase beta subunit